MNDSIELGDYVLLPYNDSEVGKVVAMEALPCGDVDCRVIVSDGTQRTYLLSVLRKVRGHKDKVFATKSNDIKPGDYVRVPDGSGPWKVLKCWDVCGDLRCCVEIVGRTTKTYRAENLRKVLDGPSTKKPITIRAGTSWSFNYNDAESLRFPSIEMSYADAQVLRFQLDLALESARRKETP